MRGPGDPVSPLSPGEPGGPWRPGGPVRASPGNKQILYHKAASRDK